MTAPGPGGLGQVPSWLSHSRLQPQEPRASAVLFAGQDLFGCCGAATCPALTGWPWSCKDARCSSSLPVLLLTLHPGREMLQGSGFPLRINSRDILLSLVWNLDVQFRCWCWKLLCGDLSPWDTPTFHRDAQTPASVSDCSKG